jgi:hypothetical protein
MSFKSEKSDSKLNIRNIKVENNEYTQFLNGADSPVKIPSKMLIRNDPKFQLEYKYEQDKRIHLPQDSRLSNEIPISDEFNRILQSSQYSSGEGSDESPRRDMLINKSSPGKLKNSKYTIFPSSIEKPTTRDKRSRGLFKAGESVISDNVNLSQERVLNYSRQDNLYENAPKSSENYPSASTDLPSNSTIIRIREKNNNFKKKKGCLDYTTDEETKINSKRRDVMKALGRLKKIEKLEQKILGRVREEINSHKIGQAVEKHPSVVRLEEERRRDEEERKLKRKELFERKQKLIFERKQLELKRQKRLENQSNA